MALACLRLGGALTGALSACGISAYRGGRCSAKGSRASGNLRFSINLDSRNHDLLLLTCSQVKPVDTTVLEYRVWYRGVEVKTVSPAPLECCQRMLQVGPAYGNWLSCVIWSLREVVGRWCCCWRLMNDS